MNRRQALTTGASLACAMVPGGNARARSVTQDTSGRPSVVGAWRLLSIATVRPNGEEVTDWAGPKPTGILITRPTATCPSKSRATRPPVGAIQLRSRRRSPSVRAPSTDTTDTSDASQSTSRAASSLILSKAVSNRMRWASGYERQLRLEGDRLLLTGTPFTFDGEQRFNRLVWQRVKTV